MRNSKLKKYEWVICILIILLGILFIALPNTGEFALLDGILEAMIFIGIAIFITIRQSKIIKKKHEGRLVLRVSCIIAIWILTLSFSKNVMLDIVQGTQKIHLEDITMNQLSGRYGIISQEYYLTGEDEQGNQVNLEVDRQDYENVKTKSAEIVYYKNMEKLVEMH